MTLRRLALTCAATVALAVGPADAGARETDAPALPATDTVLTVTRGERLLIRDVDGEVDVTAVPGESVRIEVLDAAEARLSVERSGNGPILDGRRDDVSLRVEVPAWLPVVVQGRDVDVTVRGLDAGLVARTLSGDVRLVDVSGEVRVRAMDGDVVAENVAGDLVLNSVDDDVRVNGARGTLTASTTDGDVILERMEVEVLEAGTTDGDVVFSGVLHPDGVYQLVTHSGDIEFTISRDSDARVEISTYSGSFEAGFPVLLDGIRSGRRTGFTLGAGSARVTLEAFDGDIVLREPGSRPLESTLQQGMR